MLRPESFRPLRLHRGDPASEVQLVTGGPPQAVVEQVAELRRTAREEGRTPELGIRLRVVTRATSAEAWAAAAGFARGPETTVVGSYDEVADRIEEYADLGIAHLVLADDSAEEAAQITTHLLPLLDARALCAIG